MKKLISILAVCLTATASNAAIKRVVPNWSNEDKQEFRQMFYRFIPFYEVNSVNSAVRENNFIECMQDYYSNLYSFSKLSRWQDEDYLMTVDEQAELATVYFNCNSEHNDETSKGA